MKQPLAARMRPVKFTEIIGHKEIVGETSWLRKAVLENYLPSIIFFGPPGSGKTTIAEVIATESKMHFVKLNATNASVADIRKIAEEAKVRLHGILGERTILFIDEIHRFHKGQQDVLLPLIENGWLHLIGATTENPYFSLNSPLLSRVRLVRLMKLKKEEIVLILKKALKDEKKGMGMEWQGEFKEGVPDVLADFSAGDARRALNILEQVVYLAKDNDLKEIDFELLENVVGERVQFYDRQGDEHYDLASAFIKSMRGSDPDATVHYLARMLAGGEDVRFIARRIMICAAEDVGNADAQAILVATAAMQAVQMIGMPEARIVLAQAALYVACAPKSNAVYLAIENALADVKKENVGQVPMHLRDAHYKGADNLKHGLNYKYAHDYPYGFVKQDYLPIEIRNKKYYQPKSYGLEKTIKERLEFWKKLTQKEDWRD